MSDIIHALWAFYADPANHFATTSLAFGELCLIAILSAVVIGVVLGFAVSRNPILAFVAINLSGLMRAIPVIAFLIAVLPYLGIGFVPAVVAFDSSGYPSCSLKYLYRAS